MTNNSKGDKTIIRWPDEFNGQLCQVGNKYWGLKMYPLRPGEYGIASVIIPDPCQESQGMLIKDKGL